MHSPFAFQKVCSAPVRELQNRRLQNKRQSVARSQSLIKWHDPAAERVFARNDWPHNRATGYSVAEVATSENLVRMNSYFARYGPSDTTVRRDIRPQAEAICVSIARESWPTYNRIHQFADALELLADIGSDIGPKGQHRLRKVRFQLGSLARFYWQENDYVHFCRVALKLSNVCRLLNDDDSAMQLGRHGLQILYGCQDFEDYAGSDVLLSETIIFDLKMRPFTAMRRELLRGHITKCGEERIHLLEALAERGPEMRLNMTREFAALANKRAQFVEARKWGERLVAQLSTISGLPNCVGPTLIRPRIELLTLVGKREEAIELIRDYHAAYEKDRRRLPYQQIRKWNAQYKLGLKISPPTYESPVIVELARGRMSA